MATTTSPVLPALFVERQPFWRPWWWLALGVPLVVGGAVFLGLRQVAQVPASAKWLSWLPVVLTAGLFTVLRLDTHIDAEGVCYRLAPLRWRRIRWVEVQRAYVRQYAPLGEYGGWGIKGYSTTNYAYNVSGNQGLQLELTDGHRVLLGTQQPEKLRELLRQTGK